MHAEPEHDLGNAQSGALRDPASTISYVIPPWTCSLHVTCNDTRVHISPGPLNGRAQAREGTKGVNNLMATFRTAAAVLGVAVKAVAEAAADVEKHTNSELPPLLLHAACDNLSERSTGCRLL